MGVTNSMGRILRKIVGKNSLAKLMLTIGFDYKDALLIEDVVEGRSGPSTTRSVRLDQASHAHRKFVDAEGFGEQIHAIVEKVATYLGLSRIAGHE